MVGHRSALCVAADADRAQVIADWTDRMYDEHDAVHHLDVRRGETVYRVFLLVSTLQVDISFWSPAEFGASGPSFRLLFGTAADRARRCPRRHAVQAHREPHRPGADGRRDRT